MSEFQPTHNWELKLSRIIPNLTGSTDYIHPRVILSDMIQGKCSILWTYSNFIGQINSFQDNHCRRMTKSFTCNCDIFPFFNISRWMYWYCRVSRRYCEDRKYMVRLAILRNLARWVKFLLIFWPRFKFSLHWQVVANSDSQAPEALKSWHLFAVLCTPSMASNTQWKLISTQGVGDSSVKADIVKVAYANKINRSHCGFTRGVRRRGGPWSFSAEAAAPSFSLAIRIGQEGQGA